MFIFVTTVLVLYKIDQNYLQKRRRNTIRNLAPNYNIVSNVSLDHFRSVPISGEVRQVRDPQFRRQRRDVPVSRSGDAAVVAGLTQVVGSVGVDAK